MRRVIPEDLMLITADHQLVWVRPNLKRPAYLSVTRPGQTTDNDLGDQDPKNRSLPAYMGGSDVLVLAYALAHAGWMLTDFTFITNDGDDLAGDAQAAQSAALLEDFTCGTGRSEPAERLHSRSRYSSLRGFTAEKNSRNGALTCQLDRNAILTTNAADIILNAFETVSGKLANRRDPSIERREPKENNRFLRFLFRLPKNRA